MKTKLKITLTFLIGILLIGGAFAGLSVFRDIEKPKEEVDILTRMGANVWNITRIDFSDDYEQITFDARIEKRIVKLRKFKIVNETEVDLTEEEMLERIEESQDEFYKLLLAKQRFNEKEKNNSVISEEEVTFKKEVIGVGK